MNIGALTSDPSLARHDQLTKTVEKWVGQTFFGTILKQMRDSPFKDHMFSGGRGGEAFGAMFDQRLADQMSRGVGSKIVNAIVRKIEAKHAYQKQAPARQGSKRQGSKRQGSKRPASKCQGESDRKCPVNSLNSSRLWPS